MKTSEISIRFVPSKATAQQLDELGRITQMTPQAIIGDIVSFELEAMFGNTEDSANSLQKYLYRQDFSREQATKVAAAYNAFVVRQAEHTGRPATNAAVVESTGLRRAPSRHAKRCKPLSLE